jgi:curli biogenesis system outer membrane secretion channel CsgG
MPPSFALRLLPFLLALSTVAQPVVSVAQPPSSQPAAHSEPAAPTVMVMIAEQQIGQEYLVYWWSIFGSGKPEFKAQETSLGIAESVLTDKLREAGFAPVDVSLKSGGVVKLDKAYGMADLNNQSVSAVGRIFGADYVIIGKALTRQGNKLAGSAMTTVYANLSARTVRVSTGEVVASGTVSASGLHVDETTAGVMALKEGAAELATALLERMTPLLHAR